MLKQFSAAKKPSPFKIGFKNGVFSLIEGINLTFTYRDPQMAHPLQERRLMTYFV